MLRLKETSPVLSGFDLFNPECLDKSEQNRKELSHILTNQILINTTITAVPVINLIHAASELEDFMEAFNDGVEHLSDKLNKQAKQLVEEGTLTEPEHFVVEKKPTAADVYKYVAADGSLKQFTNKGTLSLFKMALLIPPMTSNVERGFSVMNLICFTNKVSVAIKYLTSGLDVILFFRDVNFEMS